MAEQQVRVTGQDIEAVGEKIEALRNNLSESEQAVLGWLMQRAAEAPPDEEVSGFLGGSSFQASQFSLQPGFKTALPGALGLPGLQAGGIQRPGGLAAVSVTVGVKF